MGDLSLPYDFIGVGGVGVDLTLSVDSLPLGDAKIPAQLIGYLPGGFIANATCAAARLGLRAGFVGWVGDDPHGALLRRDFERWGVDYTGLDTLPDMATAFTVVITDARGDRCILLPDTPIFRQSPSPRQIELAAQARLIYSYPRDRAWCETLIHAAQRGGSGLALDIESVNDMPPDELRHVIEQAALVFLSAETLTRLGESSIEALAGPNRWIMLTAGSHGAYGAGGEWAVRVFVPAHPVAHVVDTTGAGDAFHAAVIAAYLDGAALPDALAFGAAAAALKIQHRGARGGLPARAEVNNLLHGKDGPQ